MDLHFDNHNLKELEIFHQVKYIKELLKIKIH